MKARLHAHKMAAVRTKRCYRDYELRIKAKMQRKRTREEQVHGVTMVTLLASH